MGFLRKIFGVRAVNPENEYSGQNNQGTISNMDAQSIIDTAQKYEREKNHREAMNLYKKAADYNHPIGLYKVAVSYRDSGDDETAFKYFQKAAECGHAGACYFLADYYMDGVIVQKSEEKAFEYYKRSAELGDEAGQAYLGMFYLDGTGTTPDDKAAFFWLSKCPDIDWSGYGLCKCYLFGRGTVRDINKGISILMDIAKPQSSNVFVNEARQLARECANQGFPIPKEFLSAIDEADNRMSSLIDELIETFDDSEFSY